MSRTHRNNAKYGTSQTRTRERLLQTSRMLREQRDIGTIALADYYETQDRIARLIAKNGGTH